MQERELPDWALHPRHLAARKKKRAEEKRKEKRRDHKAQVKEAARIRKFQGEDYPYGSKYGEGAILALIICLHEYGDRPFQIADFLNQKMLPARGKRWYETSVQRIVERVIGG